MTGGAQLVAECQQYVHKHGELSSGEVFVSSAGSLPCKSVIHTVGPMWKDGSKNEDVDLRRAVEAAVEEADRRKYRSVSLPAVSCGVYGFPAERGAKIILSAVRQSLNSCRSLTEVNVVSGQAVIQSFHETLTTTFGASNVKQVGQKPPQSDDNGKYYTSCCPGEFGSFYDKKKEKKEEEEEEGEQEQENYTVLKNGTLLYL